MQKTFSKVIYRVFLKIKVMDGKRILWGKFVRLLLVNHPKESWDVFSSTSKELQDELNKRAWVDTLPRFALRPAALDHGRYVRFEAFLKDAGLIKSINPVSKLAIDVTAE